MRRHWYPLADRYLGRFAGAATMIARLLESISPLNPSTHHDAAPEPLGELPSTGHDIDQFVSYADEEIRRSERTIAELNHRVRELEDQIVDYSIDHQLALEELATATEVSENGFVFMEAHLKIAKGGGHLAPRIYFYVDTPRARVHVGYFGPHYNMDNTRS